MKFLNSPRGSALVAVFALVSGLAACEYHDSVRNAAAPDASTVVIGTAPAAPSGDPPGTTAVDPGTTDTPNPQAPTPLPGQANDHSNLAKAPSQRAGTSQASP
jgi:hypothetical protein